MAHAPLTFQTHLIQKLQRRRFVLFGVAPLIAVLATPLYGDSLYRGAFEFLLFFGLWTVKSLEETGIAWDLRMPDKSEIDARRIGS